jgi:hypothetical protein
MPRPPVRPSSAAIPIAFTPCAKIAARREVFLQLRTIRPERGMLTRNENIASSGKFVGDDERQRAVLVRNRWNLRHVESNDLC